jgi:hypothetical protein
VRKYIVTGVAVFYNFLNNSQHELYLPIPVINLIILFLDFKDTVTEMRITPENDTIRIE